MVCNVCLCASRQSAIPFTRGSTFTVAPGQSVTDVRHGVLAYNAVSWQMIIAEIAQQELYPIMLLHAGGMPAQVDADISMQPACH